MVADEWSHDPICAAARVVVVKIVSRLIARCLAGIRQLWSDDVPLGDAIAAPRRQSQKGKLLIPGDQSGSQGLTHRDHRLGGERGAREVLGAVIAATPQGHNMFAVTDWRRQAAHGNVNAD
jgi:hypothetical protein